MPKSLAYLAMQRKAHSPRGVAPVQHGEFLDVAVFVTLFEVHVVGVHVQVSVAAVCDTKKR